MITIALAAGVFGGVVGAYRGGAQVLFGAVKMPLVLLITAVVSTPALIGIARAFDVRIEAREAVVLALASCARFALVLAGLAPIVWLVEGGLGYHQVALCITVCCGVAGVGSSQVLFLGLSRKGRWGAAAGVAFVAVHAIVGGHTAWMLRPYLVRPRTPATPLLRGVEGDLFTSVGLSARSARGIYARDALRVRPPAERTSDDARHAPIGGDEGASRGVPIGDGERGAR